MNIHKQADLVSIIIPVYNVEAYLGQCIDSVIQQTESNLEIILVDDGSTDKSGIICDSYSKVDERIKVRIVPFSFRGQLCLFIPRGRCTALKSSELCSPACGKIY